MRIFGYSIFEKVSEQKVPEVLDSNNYPEATSFVFGSTNGRFTSSSLVNSYVFNGEKTQGELGPPVILIPDHLALRLRAHEANLTSDVIKIITGKFFKWVVGTGLTLQAEPIESILKLEKVDENFREFVSNIESYFLLFSESNESDYSGMCSLHDNASKAFETSFLGGDALIVIRLDDNLNITVQVIDGQHISTPILQGSFLAEATARGNTIKHGIEMDKKGQHVAFYVLKDDENKTSLPTYERILARGENTGLTMAWMEYGDKHRIDHHRGIPRITSIIEKVQKLDRYTEASVSSAEERAKLPWTIEHSRFSDGENPMLGNLKKNNGGSVVESSYILGHESARNISISENKQVWNMPVDSKLKTLDSKAEIQYEPFFRAVFDQLCAAVDIPPEVALQKYNSNYSASRAAINGWEYIIKIYRTRHAKGFYKPIYDVWLYVHILKNKVNAMGYLKAVSDNNKYILKAYSNCRFTGTNMPHIDPLKEINAIRKMLGDRTKGEAALISHKQATEQLGNGEWNENYKNYAEEQKEIDKVNPPHTPVETKIITK